MTAFTPSFRAPTTGPAGMPPIFFFDDFIVGAGYTAGNEAVTSGQGKFSELADYGDWLVTPNNGGNETITSLDNAPGGEVQLHNSDDTDNILNCQMNGEAWTLDADKALTFEIRVRIADVSEADWLFGLAITNNDILDTATDYGTLEFVGFACPDSTADIDAVTVTGTTETITDTGSNLVDATYVRLGFVATLGKVQFYVDGALKATHTTNITSDNLTLSMELRNDGTVADTTAVVDYIFCSRDR